MGSSKMQSQQTALLTFMRHGEKNQTGDLTLTGAVQAKRAGVKTESLDGDVLLFHSGVGRVRDTIRAAAAHLRLTQESEESLELGQHIADYIAPGLQYFRDVNNRGEYYESWDSGHQTPETTAERMRALLALEGQSPQEGVCYSPRQMAQHIAIMIGIQVRFANMTDLSEKVNFINGSHEPVLMSFMHYFLHDFNPTGKDTVGLLGGSIGYAEAFEIGVHHRSPTDFDVAFRFRDIVRPVDLVALRAFGYAE